MRRLPRLDALASAALFSLHAAAASGYQLGHRVVTWQDPARGNRSIATDLYYPADVAGDGVPVATPPAGGFPVVAFGHGFLLGSNLYSFLQNTLAPAGYIVVLPATEGGLLPNHASFGEDLAFLVNALKEQGGNPASFLYGAVAARGAVAGHSMGGGASFLGANGDPGVDAVFHFAAANTNPSAIAAAAGVVVPTLVIAAENDCVAPPGSHQLPMYAASASECRVYVEIGGASHCQFNDYSLTCALGEFCSPAIPRGTQFALSTAILVPWLDAALREAPGAWDAFQAALAADPGYAVEQDCPVPPGPACDNDADDDGDGLADHPSDPGCAGAADISEREPGLACDDGADNDGDGLADEPADPGCASAGAPREDPKCQDGADNDGDGRVDFDGGQSIHGACAGGTCPPGVSDPDVDGVADPDPHCTTPSRSKEAAGCGLGFEVAAALLALRAARRRGRADGRGGSWPSGERRGRAARVRR